MDDATSLRYALVEELKQKGRLNDPAIEAAMRIVPRHLFLPQVTLSEVYADIAIPTKIGDGRPLSSSSQPTIMAIMLEQLGMLCGAHVLEIGAGTGYNAALLSYLVGPRGHVTTIDVDQDIVVSARENLARASIENVEVICADGGFGYQSLAPYDAIIVTVGVWDLSPHWMEQLRVGGRLVAPVSLGIRQFSIAFENAGSRLASSGIVACGFLPLRGAFAGPNIFAESDGIFIQSERASTLDTTELADLFSLQPRKIVIPEITTNVSPGLLDYTALHGGNLISLFDKDRRIFNGLFQYGLIDKSSLVVVGFDSDEADRLNPSVQVFGDDSAPEQLRGYAQEWAKQAIRI